MKKILLAVSVIIMTTAFMSCEQKTKENHETSELMISKQEVLDAQKVWGNGIVQIGKVYSDGGDYVAAAQDHINTLYGYSLGEVLFKPTLASDIQFRTDKEGALSYFVGGNPNFPEDHGFAIKPWDNVRWESIGIKTNGNMAIAMGNYYFTPAGGGDEVKVEYSFGYTKDAEGKLRIIMHGSHVPYSHK
ncbi:phosphoribosyl-AMP cyclohydrolase [Bacteroidota bacterium]